VLVDFGLDSDLGSLTDEGFSDRCSEDDGFSDRSIEDDGFSDCAVEDDGFSDRSVEDDGLSDCSGELGVFELFSVGEMDSPLDSIAAFALIFFVGGEMDSPFIVCDFSTSASSCGTSFNASVRFTVTVVRKSRRNELNGYRNI
jgi:hypothetical protein